MKKNQITKETLEALTDLEEALALSQTSLPYALRQFASELRRLGPSKKAPWIRLACNETKLRAKLESIVSVLDIALPDLREAVMEDGLSSYGKKSEEVAA